MSGTVSERYAALVSAGEIEHDEERIRALTDTANLFLEAKRNDRAIETFDKVKTEGEQLDNVHRDFFLSAAAVGFLRAGSLEVAPLQSYSS